MAVEESITVSIDTAINEAKKVLHQQCSQYFKEAPNYQVPRAEG
jgi:hypothetical protein